MSKNIKQVIILRKDLNMRKGKCVVQGAHASSRICMEFEREWCPDHGFALIPYGPEFASWLCGEQTKICVGVDSEAELLGVFARAEAAGLPCALIKDLGHTEFKEPTFTAVAIGPAQSELIDPITGKLKLL